MRLFKKLLPRDLGVKKFGLENLSLVLRNSEKYKDLFENFEFKHHDHVSDAKFISLLSNRLLKDKVEEEGRSFSEQECINLLIKTFNLKKSSEKISLFSVKYNKKK